MCTRSFSHATGRTGSRQLLKSLDEFVSESARDGTPEVASHTRHLRLAGPEGWSLPSWLEWLALGLLETLGNHKFCVHSTKLFCVFHKIYIAREISEILSGRCCLPEKNNSLNKSLSSGRCYLPEERLLLRLGSIHVEMCTCRYWLGHYH